MAGWMRILCPYNRTAELSMYTVALLINVAQLPGTSNVRARLFPSIALTS